ncbi:MAG TPA: AmiS/UreI family transporter [Salinisphaeraceae bacterium]|nr:AmiS/UreI family transporter [Salinisphaeraceae bacterium]
MVSVVLLYVGAVLFCNGIWLLGRISDKEIRIINIFTGSTNVIISIIAITIAEIQGDFALIVFSAQILLFAFTYLWVAFNNHTEADGRGLGWFCLFVALTAAPTSALTLQNAGSDPWLIWLGFNWAAWAVLWFLYWGLLAAAWPIQRITGYVTTIEGILTGWLPAYLVMMGFLSLPS